ncbi:MAG TPA: efflux transporter outer membrane subunit, partial [Bdellovibrio sp.]|nr:efflux transporter outer membrane subunit [Bdellovibrio sp.]
MMKRLIIFCLVISACAVGPDYKRTNVRTPDKMPALQTGELEQKELIDTTWWRVFGDPQIENLIKAALDHNLDLQIALSRVDEARASLGISKSDFYPSIDLSAIGARQKVSETAGAIPVPSSLSKYNQYALGLNLSYELDLWGKIRRSNEAARAELFQADFNRANVQLTLISQVVTTYFLLRSLDLQLDIARNTFRSRQDSYELIFKRFKGGLTSELNARQSEAEMHSAQASVAQFENQVSRAESSLSILLGRDPKELIESPLARGKGMRDFIVPPTLPTMIPSKLLERRPDIAAAEEQLIAANARIGVAKSYYFPSISLIGGLGVE